MSNDGAASSGFVLPEKWSEDLVDENGNKMSKRYEYIGNILYRRQKPTPSLVYCSEFKKRHKMLLKQKEQAEKKVRQILKRFGI
jgi:hypothetical protein